MQLKVDRRHRRLTLWAALVAVLAMIAAAALLPAGSVAEQASQPSSPAAAQLDAGRNHSCAIVTAGTVRCWGFSGEGELGYGNTDTVGDDETPGVVGPVDLGAGRTAASISSGHFHTCARLDDGSVRCWGFGSNGRLGYGTNFNVGDTESPGSLEPLRLGGRASSISAGGSHTCALLENATVRCWGYGAYGALGYGGEANVPGIPGPPDIGDDEAPDILGPVNFGGGRTVLAITAGGYHTCALLDDRTIRCWGYGGNGQLGVPRTGNVSDPTTVGAVDVGRPAVAISAGELHTCALLDDGNVRCWGTGLDGRLGTGNITNIGDDETPGSIPPVNLGGRTAVAVSAGDAHTCVLLTGGDVRCWGAAALGQLGTSSTMNIGDDETAERAGNVNLGQGRTATAISAGGRHTCARLADAGIICWGYAGNGRLGYCNERNVGDNELPGSVGAVPVDLRVRAPSTEYPGCARPTRGGSTPPPPIPGGGARSGGDVAAALAAEAGRRRTLRGCLASATRHARRETRRARRTGGGARARLRRHIKRHRSRKRRACLRRHGRTPGRVTGLSARAASGSRVVLTFKAAGSDGDRLPAARTYVVKQSRRPIRSRRAFRRAQTLCRGRCRFPTVTAVGGRLTLTVEDLRSRRTYYYAVAARDNVSKRLGPRSRAVRVRTR